MANSDFWNRRLDEMNGVVKCVDCGRKQWFVNDRAQVRCMACGQVAPKTEGK